MFDETISLINNAQRVVVVQAENPDGDSLASALALEDLLEEQGKNVSLYCAIDMPKYLRYIQGWDRVVKDFVFEADLVILVDTTAESLMVKTLATPGVRHALETRPVVVIDHHNDAEDELQFEHTLLLDKNAISTAEVIYRLAQTAHWPLTANAADLILISILSDTLGMTTQNITADSFQIAADLVAHGANPAEIEERRRDYMRKPADILTYKGQLIGRIEYLLDGALALVHIPWEEIQEYSDRYNPSVLVLDEMRLVENVRVACAIKTYPDGKLTGKLRTNAPVAGDIAGFFGGGGHKYSAGFKIFESYDTTINELVNATQKALNEYDTSST